MQITDSIDCNKNVVLFSALFHDIKKPLHHIEDHGIAGAKYTEFYLQKNNYPKKFIKQVSFCISNHIKSNIEIKKISNIELSILSDADMLDEIGTMTILGDVMAEGQLERQSYLKTLKRINSSYNEQLGLEGSFHTKIDKEFYVERMNA